MHDQAREFEDFMAQKSLIDTQNPIDAEILSKEQTTTTQDPTGKKPPPPLPDTNDPLILLGLDPGASFDDVRRAYKRMAKLYHPDVVVGPDASADERREASWDFARVNAAFDILKRKEEEEVLEYTVYVDGQRETRRVVVSEESRRRDPTYINYDRIREMAEFRERHPQERMWYEMDHDYESRYNGFEVGESGYDSYSRGKWWKDRRAFERDHGFGHITSNEKRWDERHTFAGESDGYSSERGFGFIPSQERWWNEGPGFDFEAPPTGYGYHSRNSQRFDDEIMKQGYHKDRLWNEGPIYEEAGYDQPIDYDPQEYYPLKEKWWQVDDPTIGDFAP